MIEHTMNVSDAELKAAMAAIGDTVLPCAEDLLAAGWFTPAAVAKIRRMEKQPAENFCSNQARNGRFEKRRAMYADGAIRMLYRVPPGKQKKGAGK